MSPLRRPVSLSAKLGVVGALLLTLALASIGLTLWVGWQLEGGAAAVNEAGRLRMQTWRLAQQVSVGDRAQLVAPADAFERSLTLLHQGDPARPLFVPTDHATQAAFEQVQSQWSRQRVRWLGSDTTTPQQAAQQAEQLVQHIDAFVGAIELQLARWTTILSAFQLALMGLAIGGGVAMLYAAYLFVFNPLARLQTAVQQLERGELGARVDVHSDDEFGTLSQAFNRMAATLQDFTRGLESRVREKTETLRAERERLAHLYEASAFVGRAPTLDVLAQGMVRRMRGVGRGDAALLRWYDATRQQHVLLASDCLPQEMQGEERCLDEGQCHCGQASAHTLRVIPIAAAFGVPGQPAHCERFGFSTVISVPVRVHEQRLGELDLLYRSSNARLSDEDRASIESLAAHLASGMEGLRAAALEREAAVAEERGLLARELHDSIAQSLAFLKIQVQLLRSALKRDDRAAVQRTVDELDTGVRDSTADVRELLLHFRTRTNGDHIVPALQTTLHKFQLQTGLAAELQVHGNGVPPPPDVQVQLLHVVQEALSNVRKHAQAQHVHVDVYADPAWRIEVRDDGRGFDPAQAADDTHVGLRIMRERAAGIGATLAVHAAPGRGTQVSVLLPAAEAELQGEATS